MQPDRAFVTPPRQGGGTARRAGVWLFPPTYALHFGEEYLAGSGFPQWVERTLGIRFSTIEFVTWNALAFGLMCVAAWLVSRDAKHRFIEIALSIAVLANVVVHVLASLATWTYSPGVVTAITIWMPLGLVRLRHAHEAATRRGRLAGVCLGVAVLLVTLGVIVWTSVAGAM